MSEELDDLVDNIREPSVWIRITFMIAFAVVLNLIILPVIIVLVIAQALFSVLSGKNNDNLRFFGAALEKYVSQIIKFLTYNAETKPFPFSDFPDIPNEGFKDSAKSSTVDSKGSAAPANHSKQGKNKTESIEPTEKKAVKKKAVKKKVAKKKAASKKITENDDKG
ncbi:MAG: hypothetical protein COA96_00460 [SAR86 cluster bacterium]|uniref:DUF4389 domain-containing protein n=1 Tax=SAR86 cluster bacterium TaxID=2030880 RepID=A0A2A5BC03_9GAMM|nr:MAG: hypothetical protein COA96_00460 [SAR86 cluster bacterium]